MTEQNVDQTLVQKFIGIITQEDPDELQNRSQAWQIYLDAQGFMPYPMLAVDKEIIETVGVRRGKVTTSHLMGYVIDARVDMVGRLLHRLNPELRDNPSAVKFISGMFKDLQVR